MTDQSTPRMRQLQQAAKDGSQGAAVLWLLLHDKPTAEQDRVLAELTAKLETLWAHVRTVVGYLADAGLMANPAPDEPF